MYGRADAVETICRACGQRFEYARPFYETKDLRPPRRCPSCRHDSRARRQSMHGRVSSIGQGFGFVRLDGDVVEYFAPDLVDATGLRPGDAVTFEIDPTEQPQPGKRPRAFDVAPAE